MLELVLLVLTIFATVALIGGGFAVPLAFNEAGETPYYFASKAGAGIGFLISVQLWRKLLIYYRFGVQTLRPTIDQETTALGNRRDYNGEKNDG